MVRIGSCWGSFDMVAGILDMAGEKDTLVAVVVAVAVAVVVVTVVVVVDVAVVHVVVNVDFLSWILNQYPRRN